MTRIAVIAGPALATAAATMAVGNEADLERRLGMMGGDRPNEQWRKPEPKK